MLGYNLCLHWSVCSSLKSLSVALGTRSSLNYKLINKKMIINWLIHSKTSTKYLKSYLGFKEWTVWGGALFSGDGHVQLLLVYELTPRVLGKQLFLFQFQPHVNKRRPRRSSYKLLWSSRRVRGFCCSREFWVMYGTASRPVATELRDGVKVRTYVERMYECDLCEWRSARAEAQKSQWPRYESFSWEECCA